MDPNYNLDLLTLADRINIDICQPRFSPVNGGEIIGYNFSCNVSVSSVSTEYYNVGNYAVMLRA